MAGKRADTTTSSTRFWGYGGPGPEATGTQVIALTLNEISHHGTQICVLRDLYRLTGGDTARAGR